MVRRYVQVTDSLRQTLVDLIHKNNYSIAQAAKMTGIPYDNAKAINRTYSREQRIQKIDYKQRYVTRKKNNRQKCLKKKAIVKINLNSEQDSETEDLEQMSQELDEKNMLPLNFNESEPQFSLSEKAKIDFKNQQENNVVAQDYNMDCDTESENDENTDKLNLPQINDRQNSTPADGNRTFEKVLRNVEERPTPSKDHQNLEQGISKRREIFDSDSTRTKITTSKTNPEKALSTNDVSKFCRNETDMESKSEMKRAFYPSPQLLNNVIQSKLSTVKQSIQNHHMKPKALNQNIFLQVDGSLKQTLPCSPLSLPNLNYQPQRCSCGQEQMHDLEKHQLYKIIRGQAELINILRAQK